MLYTVYQITHRESGKVYIGKHQTLNIEDGYMGSGRLIRRAVKKYGREAFDKKILYVCETEAEMNAKEAELVTEEFCLLKDTYNLCPGGDGGWGYVNTIGSNLYGLNGTSGYGSENLVESNKRHHERMKTDPLYKDLVHSKMKESLRSGFETGRLTPGFYGKTHREESRKKIGEKNALKGLGNGNSQFGTIWITDGLNAKKIPKSDPLPEGFRLGRK